MLFRSAGALQISCATQDYGITAYSNQSTISNASAIFALNNHASGRVFCGSGASGTPTSEIFSNGSATFSGDVSAPNINFKLAPATVAAMPAPLIDEGFATDNTVDLLTELIKMKIQIRDLNAFMERSLQDQPET